MCLCLMTFEHSWQCKLAAVDGGGKTTWEGLLLLLSPYSTLHALGRDPPASVSLSINE